MAEYTGWDKYIQSKCEHKNINGNSATCMDCGYFNYVWDNGVFGFVRNQCQKCGNVIDDWQNEVKINIWSMAWNDHKQSFVFYHTDCYRKAYGAGEIPE